MSPEQLLSFIFCGIDTPEEKKSNCPLSSENSDWTYLKRREQEKTPTMGQKPESVVSVQEIGVSDSDSAVFRKLAQPPGLL